MKTFKGIRIGMMSLIALLVFSYASRVFAAVDAFIWFTDDKGKSTKVQVAPDGTFVTPPLHAGTYTFSFGVVSKTAIGSATGGGGAGKVLVQGGMGSPVTQSGSGDNPMESVSLNFTKVILTYTAQSSRDAASGLPTGKRMHKPFVITKELDRSSPTATTDLGTVVVDADGDGFSGSVVGMDKAGNTVVRGSWDIKSNTK